MGAGSGCENKQGRDQRDRGLFGGNSAERHSAQKDATPTEQVICNQNHEDAEKTPEVGSLCADNEIEVVPEVGPGERGDREDDRHYGRYPAQTSQG